MIMATAPNYMKRRCDARREFGPAFPFRRHCRYQPRAFSAQLGIDQDTASLDIKNGGGFLEKW